VYLRQVRTAAAVDLGRRAVVGRPVRYWGAESPDDDARAVARMRDALVLARAGATERDIDRVFATGGTSLVPAVRARLAARFGDAKLVGGEELTSVAWGLAARARQVFAQAPG